MPTIHRTHRINVFDRNRDRVSIAKQYIYPVFYSHYDEDGNVFLANYHTMEEASVVANFYNNHGIKAVIVHGADWQEPVKRFYGVSLHTVFLEDLPDLEARKASIPKEDYDEFLKEWQRVFTEKNREYEAKYHTLRLTI